MGKDGIRRERDAVAAVFELVDGLGRSGVEAAGAARVVELIGIEIFKKRLVVAGLVRTIDISEFCPEGLFVRARAVVLDHGGGTGPDGVDERLGLVAVRRELFGKELEVARGESVLVHRQQRPIQVE